MTLALIKPPPRYDQAYEIRTKQILETEDLHNRKKGTDVEIGEREKLILRAPDGTRWMLTVSSTGTLGATQL